MTEPSPRALPPRASAERSHGRARTMMLCAAVPALAGLAYVAADQTGLLGTGSQEPVDTTPPAPLQQEENDRSATLAELRRNADGAGLDAFVEEQRSLAEAAPTEPTHWRVLAEAHLERVLFRDRNRGMAVGKPTHDELPPAHREDIEAGVQAADKAIELGDPTGDAWRIRGALQSLTVTGLSDFLRVRGDVKKGYATAAEQQPGNPRLAYLHASELLFTPGWLGGDPGEAATRLEQIADVLDCDERPYVMLGFARYLQGDRNGAIAALEAALERAPANTYAAEVARRLRASEDDAFERDVTPQD